MIITVRSREDPRQNAEIENALQASMEQSTSRDGFQGTTTTVWVSFFLASGISEHKLLDGLIGNDNYAYITRLPYSSVSQFIQFKSGLGIIVCEVLRKTRR